MVASREKALCDKIITTAELNLRSQSQIRDFLLKDMRMDEHVLSGPDTRRIEDWAAHAPKRAGLKILVKTLRSL